MNFIHLQNQFCSKKFDFKLLVIVAFVICMIFSFSFSAYSWIYTSVFTLLLLIHAIFILNLTSFKTVLKIIFATIIILLGITAGYLLFFNKQNSAFYYPLLTYSCLIIFLPIHTLYINKGKWFIYCLKYYYSELIRILFFVSFIIISIYDLYAIMLWKYSYIPIIRNFFWLSVVTISFVILPIILLLKLPTKQILENGFKIKRFQKKWIWIPLFLILFFWGVGFQYYFDQQKLKQQNLEIINTTYQLLDQLFYINASKSEIIHRQGLHKLGINSTITHKYGGLNGRKIPIEVWEKKDTFKKMTYEFDLEHHQLWLVTYFFYGEKNPEKDKIFFLLSKNLAPFLVFTDQKLYMWQIGEDPIAWRISFSPIETSKNNTDSFQSGYILHIGNQY